MESALLARPDGIPMCFDIFRHRTGIPNAIIRPLAMKFLDSKAILTKLPDKR